MKKLLDSSLLFKNIIIGSVGVFIVNIFFVFFPTFWKNLFIGKEQISIAITFQDIMWFIFFIGILQIFERRRYLIQQKTEVDKNYLSEDFETILDDEELTRVIKTTKAVKTKQSILPYMILQIALQFRTNNSISLSTDFLSKQIDLFLHQTELAYNRLKYIIWVIPSIGFMGTVYGIGVAVSQLGNGSLDDPELLTKMASSLGIAFNTTLLALILSVILQYFSQKYESEEETLINSYGKYILDNFINKLVERK